VRWRTGPGLPVRAQDGHVAPGVAFFVGLGKVACNRHVFFAQAGKFDDEGLWSFAAAADGFDEGDAVVVFVPVMREAQAPSAGMRVAMLLVSQNLVVPHYEAYNEVFKEIFIIHMNISQISSDEFQVEITYIRENEQGLILTFFLIACLLKSICQKTPNSFESALIDKISVI
jgi:hypothetical protein